MNLLKQALQSSAFQRAKRKASDYAGDPVKTKRLIDEAIKLASSKKSSPLGEARAYLMTLARLSNAYLRREYRMVPWETIVLAIAALVYFVSPLDLIPDFLLGAGLLDDVAILSYVVASIKHELDQFLAWEKTRTVENASLIEKVDRDIPGMG